MKHAILRRSVLASVGLASLLMACSGAPEGSVGTEGPPADTPAIASPADATGASTPTPVATLNLENGNTLEFYDFGDRALVMEQGKVGSAPVATTGNVDDLVATWNTFSKGVPAPAALRELGHRIVDSAPPGAMSAEAAQELVSTPESATVAPSVVEKSPMGCNNGCCDPVYLEGTLGCGDKMGQSYVWYWPNINSGWWNQKVAAFYGVVCAAIGTTTFTVTAGSKGGSWSVPENSWHSYRWTADFNIFTGYHRVTVYSNTSGASGSTMHTYCGRTVT